MHWLIVWAVASFAAGLMGPAQYGDAPRSQPASANASGAAIVPASATAALAQSFAGASAGFAGYKSYLMYKARQAGVREATIQANVPGLRLNDRAMELDRAQRASPSSSGFPAFAPYRRDHVTASLIRRGQSRYYDHWGNLQRIQARYGVDPAVIMAIYGHETSYGAVTGSFDLLEVLATLAYEGRRRAMFEAEFLAALRLVDSGMPRWRLKGSYAGATGYPQFMPTVALRLRADGNGDGYADIWSNEDDAFASMANYLREAGWKPNLAWGVAVRTPPTLNRAAIRSGLVAPRCPRVFQRHSRWMTVREWRSLGLVQLGRPLPDNELTALIEPDGPGATGYLLTNNYKAILDYNCSNFYALSVGLLADAVARR